MVENNVVEILEEYHHFVFLVSMLDNLLKIDKMNKYHFEMVEVDYHSIVKLIHVYFVEME